MGQAKRTSSRAGGPAAGGVPPIVFPIAIGLALVLAAWQWRFVSSVFGVAFFFLSFLIYFIVAFVCTYVLPPQDLKKKYGAVWALVTGGSSGIGKCIATRLASQGLNVVLVGLPDELLSATAKEIREKFRVEVREVGTNLSDAQAALAKIQEATAGLDVNIVFSNAGYIVTSFFANTSLDVALRNFHTNATASLVIAHHFAQRMRQAKQRGCIVFTSSPAGLMLSPFASLYGATKAFVTELATSIAAELKPDGIDVCVIHPSPVDTNFYTGAAPQMSMIQNFKKTAVTPEIITESAFRCIGRTVVVDQGYYSIGLRVLLKLVDINLITDLAAHGTRFLPDFKVMAKK